MMMPNARFARDRKRKRTLPNEVFKRPEDIDKVHSLMSARGMDVPKEALVEILKTPQGKELLMQMKELEKAEEAQRNALSGDNADASGSDDAKQDSNDLSNEYSPEDIDKVHSLMSARGMDVPKEALVEILKTPQGKELLTQMKELEKAEEAQRNALSGDNADASGFDDAKQDSNDLPNEYSPEDIDKVHSLMSARGMDVPKEALVEILENSTRKRTSYANEGA